MTRLKWLVTMVLFILMSSRGIEANAQEEFQSLNTVIDVGDTIYVQHDTENNNVYDLKKSGTGTTTVYQVILADFTADKVWTTEGKYVDNVSSTAPHGATAPEDYVPVKAGEKYFIKTYGVGWNSDGVWYAPVIFFDDKDNMISHELANTLSKSKAGVMVTVPENATKMHLTMFNHQNFTLQKELNLTDKEFNNLPINRTALEAEIAQKYEEYQKDRTVYQKLDKAYITFVNDDTWGSIAEYAKLFESKNVPLVLATIPELLIENSSSKYESRLDIARKVEEVGGEIIAHNGGVLTQEGFSDYNTMYSFFVRSKQMFNHYGFDVNGIILAGGAGQVAGAQESEEWASSIYSYSDLYGMEYDKKEIALDSAYYHRRTGLGNFKNDLDRIKQTVDDAINNKSWLIFYFHTEQEIDLDLLSQTLDYVNSKDEAELEIVTYKEMYQKNAKKESEIINNVNTYYVSSTGTSQLGISEAEPMSYETAKNKTYVSGDTILFKRGDTFYGTFNPTIVQNSDEMITISSYGEGELPTISAYKIADSEECWQMHVEGLYKVPLGNSKYFKGLSSVDENSVNVGFLEDAKGVKYFNKKSSLSYLKDEYDFYCDTYYIYMKSSENPYKRLGELKISTKNNLLILHSNMKVENIRFCGTGAHAMVGSDENTKNVIISNNIIENIGGSYLKSNIRYGNGIEFYGTNVSDVLVENNIIRNTYDVGFTIQGTKGSGKNVVVKNNAFVNNSHDSEIWESEAATGVESYEFTNNISVNVGRGWGHEAREDKYDTAHVLFWNYLLENTDIYFHHNIVYNPRRIYFIEQTGGTNVYFQEKDYIKSDYNTYMLGEDATIFRHLYKIGEKDEFISAYKKDVHSEFQLIEVDEKIVQTSSSTNDISEIRKLFGVEVIITPTATLTSTPSLKPTVTLTPAPTAKPTQMTTKAPSQSADVTVTPTQMVTKAPSQSPDVTVTPTQMITKAPSQSPDVKVTPTQMVTKAPSQGPEMTVAPTQMVTKAPSQGPEMIVTPTQMATEAPSKGPDVTVVPTQMATKAPSQSPDVTMTPTQIATKAPSKSPDVTVAPSQMVTKIPTNSPEMTVTPIIVLPAKNTKLVDEKTNDVYTVTKLGEKVSYTKPGDKDITSVTIPKEIRIDGITYKVTAVASNAFKNCKKLKKIDIPDGITTIGNSAFFGCKKLKTVSLGKNVTKIGDKAFYKCSSMTKITIPSNVKKIGKRAFYKCNKLKYINIKTCKLNSKNVGSEAFKGINSKAGIQVPKKKLNSYKKMLKKKGIGSKIKVYYSVTIRVYE